MQIHVSALASLVSYQRQYSLFVIHFMMAVAIKPYHLENISAQKLLEASSRSLWFFTFLQLNLNDSSFVRSSPCRFQLGILKYLDLPLTDTNIRSLLQFPYHNIRHTLCHSIELSIKSNQINLDCSNLGIMKRRKWKQIAKMLFTKI